jgi:hypothetical protein
MVIMGKSGGWAMWMASKNTTDGSDVNSFGDHGISVFDPTYSFDVPAGMLITANDKIVVGTSTMSYRWSVVRFEPNGSVTADFGVSGYMLIENGYNVESFVTGIAMQSNGKYVLVGGSKFPSANNWDFMVLRFVDNPETLSGIDENPAFPSRLSQNFPNPFNQATTISWSQASDSHVSIVIYDILGNSVAKPVNETLPAGKHQYIYDQGGTGTLGLPAGNYFYQIQILPIGNATKPFIETRKMTILPGGGH